MMQITASTSVQGIHRWPEAPEHRLYLASYHHHMFMITVWAEVTHTERDIEFHDLKALIDNALQLFSKTSVGIIDFGSMSCESIAKFLLEQLPVVDSILVSEDGQFGAIVDRDSIEGGFRPEVVTICGSTKFKKEWEKVVADLELQGKAVFSVGSFMHADNISFDPIMKAMLDNLHKSKIAMSDRVFVINVGGYIGESTRGEIAYAESLNLPVEYLENKEDIE